MRRRNRLRKGWGPREDVIFSENYKYLSMVEPFSAAGAKEREVPLSSRKLEGTLIKESEAGECHVGNRLDVGKKPCRRRCDGTQPHMVQ